MIRSILRAGREIVSCSPEIARSLAIGVVKATRQFLGEEIIIPQIEKNKDFWLRAEVCQLLRWLKTQEDNLEK